MTVKVFLYKGKTITRKFPNKSFREIGNILREEYGNNFFGWIFIR